MRRGLAIGWNTDKRPVLQRRHRIFFSTSLRHDGDQPIDKLRLIFCLDLNDVGVPTVEQISTVCIRHRLLKRLKHNILRCITMSQLPPFPWSSSYSCPLLGEPPPPRKDHLQSQEAWSAPGARRRTSWEWSKFQVSAEQEVHGDQESDQVNTQQVVHGDQESPGGGAGYIGGEEKVCKVGDCVWTAQVLRGSLLI